MKILPFLILLMIGFTGCGETPTIAKLNPKIKVTFKEMGKKIGKTNEEWVVMLQVSSQSGKDYSPAPQTVSTTQQYADFELSIPADSTYKFTAKYFLNDKLKAEGSTQTLIDAKTESVTIPVTVFPPNELPFVGAIPTLNRVSLAQTPKIELALKVYNPPSIIKTGKLRFNLRTEGISIDALSFKRGNLTPIPNAFLYQQDLQLQTQDFIIDTLWIDLQKATNNRIRIQADMASFSNPMVLWYPFNVFDVVIDVLP